MMIDVERTNGMDVEKAIAILERKTTIPGDGYTWEEIEQAIAMAVLSLKNQVGEEPLTLDRKTRENCKSCDIRETEMTNGDKIRSMTDEQLLDFMIKTVGNAVLCRSLGTEPKFFTLEWLKSPAIGN